MNRLTDYCGCGLEDCAHSLNIATAATECTAAILTSYRHANPDALAIESQFAIDPDRCWVSQKGLK
jgi:hypothetical protein